MKMLMEGPYTLAGETAHPQQAGHLSNEQAVGVLTKVLHPACATSCWPTSPRPTTPPSWHARLPPVFLATVRHTCNLLCGRTRRAHAAAGKYSPVFAVIEKKALQDSAAGF
jgi:hypothetical protein